MLKKLDRKNKDIGATKKVLVVDEVEKMVEDMVEDIIVEDTVEDIDEFARFDDSKSDETEDEIEDEVDEDDDSVEEDEADEDDDDEPEDDDETDAMEDLLMVINEKRKAQLDEGDYIAVLTDVVAEQKLAGKYGKPWVSIGLKFKIKNRDTQENVEVTFNANRSLDPKSRLYPIVKGILGSEPGDSFNLKELKGKKARVSIEHSTDDEGNVWDNIVAARKYISKKK